MRSTPSCSLSTLVIVAIVALAPGIRASASQCEDDADWDYDSESAYPEDPGCESPSDPGETDPNLPCDDWVDADGDGGPRFLLDRGCESPSDPDERSPDFECDNGRDDDHDGLVDYPQDPGCADPWLGSESPECDDGRDNDRDGAADFPEDPGCASASDPDETALCSNGRDDDGDGAIDFPDDPGCASAYSDEEAPFCNDGRDIDLDGYADFPKDPGCASASDDSELDPALPCDDGRDNDLDWAWDRADPGCASPLDPSESDPAVACDDGLDNDGDLRVDFRWDLECESRVDTSEVAKPAPIPFCADGVDNDGDGLTDHPQDPDCSDPSDPSERDADPTRVRQILERGSIPGPDGSLYYWEPAGCFAKLCELIRVAPDGTRTRLIGNEGDGRGNPLSTTRVQRPVFDARGNAWVTGYQTNNLFRITKGGRVREVVDVTGDGVFPFYHPNIAAGLDGNVYAESIGTVFRARPNGRLERVAGPRGPEIGAERLWSPSEFGGIAAAADGTIFLGIGTSSLRTPRATFEKGVLAIDPSGEIRQLAGHEGDGRGNLLIPSLRLAVGPDGEVYAQSGGKGPQPLLRIDRDGAVRVAVGIEGDGVGNRLFNVSHLSVDAQGNLFVGATRSVFHVTPDGVVREIFDDATNDYPYATPGFGVWPAGRNRVIVDSGPAGTFEVDVSDAAAPGRRGR